MKIIEQERAPNPRRVKIFIAEKGLDIPFEKLELNKGEHQTPEFTALNPMQRVPILLFDDGSTLNRNQFAICRYFEELHPSPSLFWVVSPLSKSQNRNVEQADGAQPTDCLCPQVFRHSHPAMARMENPQIPQWARANVQRVHAMLEILENELASSLICCRRGSTRLLDITALVAVDFMKPARTNTAP